MKLILLASALAIASAQQTYYWKRPNQDAPGTVSSKSLCIDLPGICGSPCIRRSPLHSWLQTSCYACAHNENRKDAAAESGAQLDVVTGHFPFAVVVCGHTPDANLSSCRSHATSTCIFAGYPAHCWCDAPAAGRCMHGITQLCCFQHRWLVEECDQHHGKCAAVKCRHTLPAHPKRTRASRRTPHQLLPSGTAQTCSCKCASQACAFRQPVYLLQTNGQPCDLYLKQYSPEPGSGLSLWPIPTDITTGATTLTVAPAFNFVATTPSNDLSAAFTRISALIFQHNQPASVMAAAARARVAATGGQAVFERKLQAGPTLTQLTVTVNNISAPLQLGVDESYTLNVPADGTAATLTANTVYGAYHGLQTFSQVGCLAAATAVLITCIGSRRRRDAVARPLPPPQLSLPPPHPCPTAADGHVVA